MRIIICAFLASLVSMTMVACTVPLIKTVMDNECIYPGYDKPAPSWICDASVDGISLGAVGSSPKSDAGVAFMKQMAATDASVQLAEKMKLQVQRMISQYAEEHGAYTKSVVDRIHISVSKQITYQTLQGAKIFRSIVASEGTMYVLLGLDNESIQRLTETAVKISITNEPEAWKQFKVQKGPDELAVGISTQRVSKFK